MTTRWNGFKSVLAIHIENYLRAKRAVGCKFDNEDRQLRLLDSFLHNRGVEQISSIDAKCLQDFLNLRPRSNSRSYNLLLSNVRRLFDWMVVQQIIPATPLTARSRRDTSRRLPFLFSEEEIKKLLALVKELPDGTRAELRGITYETIFSLLASLGLRVSEVAHLQWGDVDLERDLLEIRNTKFGKSRIVPFGPKMADKIILYKREREQRKYQCEGVHYLFSWNDRTPISTNSIRNIMRDEILPQMELVIPPGVFGPHVHCLRHSFAVRTLLNWYRSGVSPSDRMHHLSTFLGHTNPNSTAVYLSITSELLDAANQRFESFAPALSHGGEP